MKGGRGGYAEGSIDQMKHSLCRELEGDNYASKVYKGSVTYHDFLHLTYYKESQKLEKKDVRKWVGEVKFYTDGRSNLKVTHSP